MYIELKSENRLAIACLEKKPEHRWLIVAIKRIIFFKSSFFENIKELFKSNQNGCMSFIMFIEFKNENRLALSCLERNSEFRWLIIKKRTAPPPPSSTFLKTSRRCSNQTKFIV